MTWFFLLVTQSLLRSLFRLCMLHKIMHTNPAQLCFRLLWYPWRIVRASSRGFALFWHLLP